MTEYKKLIHKEDWGGGYLIIEDSTTKIEAPEQIFPDVQIFRKGSLVGGGVVTGRRSIRGTDRDHGHTYEWSAFDLNIRIAPIGYGVTVRELNRQGFDVHVKIA